MQLRIPTEASKTLSQVDSINLSYKSLLICHIQSLSSMNNFVTITYLFDKYLKKSITRLSNDWCNDDVIITNT